MKVDTAIILAGGKSTRMGFDKQLIKIKDQLIVDYLAEKLKRYFSQIIVVTKTPDLYKGKGYTICQDHYDNLGPLAGIHSGLMETKSDAAFVIACDMPHINDSYISYIVDKFENGEGDGLVGEVDGFIEPMAGIYGKNLLGEIENRLEKKDLKLKNLIETQDFLIVGEEEIRDFDKDKRIFKNYNYRKDLEKLET